MIRDYSYNDGGRSLHMYLHPFEGKLSITASHEKKSKYIHDPYICNIAYEWAMDFDFKGEYNEVQALQERFMMNPLDTNKDLSECCEAGMDCCGGRSCGCLTRILNPGSEHYSRRMHIKMSPDHPHVPIVYWLGAGGSGAVLELKSIHYSGGWMPC